MSNSKIILSDKCPKRGQNHRSSSNFDTSALVGDAMKWSCEDGISFTVNMDIGSGGADREIISSVRNGSITEMVHSAKLYISDPKGASEPFEITVSGTNYEVNPSSWMKDLCDVGKGKVKISQLSIPGTHDSGTGKADGISKPWAKCQSGTILQQLQAGIRFLDIRCRHINDRFTIHHGPVYLDLNFDDVLMQCRNFLNTNPHECILMSIKEEHHAENCTRSFVATFDHYSGQSDNWYLKNNIPTLEETKNKIVIWRRFGASNDKDRGLDFSGWKDDCTFDINLSDTETGLIQDEYTYDTIKGKTHKWNAVSSLLNKAKDGTIDKLFLNYTSATGLDGISSVVGFVNTPYHIAVDDINPELRKYFNTNSKGRFGIIVMDFPEQTLITKIIATNK